MDNVDFRSNIARATRFNTEVSRQLLSIAASDTVIENVQKSTGQLTNHRLRAGSEPDLLLTSTVLHFHSDPIIIVITNLPDAPLRFPAELLPFPVDAGVQLEDES
jgi:hypothetical protein